MNILNRTFWLCRSVLIGFRTQAKLYSHFLLLLILITTAQTTFASGCVNMGSTAHVRMFAQAQIKLSGNVEKYQEIGRYSFEEDAIGVPYIANCSPGATIYAVAGTGEPATKNAVYFDHIDGQPAFYLPRGNNEYAYVLIDNDTGLAFGNNQYYSTIPVNDDKMKSRQATVILYAAMDNPTLSVQLGNVVLGGLRPEVSNEYRTGYTYMFKSGSIDAAPVSCDLDNPDNLSITLPRSPVSAFNDIGDTHASESTDLRITCTGDMTAKMSLRLDGDQVERDDYGHYTVIKNEREGDEYAKGIGFVLSAHGDRLIDDEWVQLPNLGHGTTHIPIEAKYYRYGNSTSAGKVQAIANFVVEFN